MIEYYEQGESCQLMFAVTLKRSLFLVPVRILGFFHAIPVFSLEPEIFLQ